MATQASSSAKGSQAGGGTLPRSSAYLMLAPLLILLGAVFFYPILSLLVQSFTLPEPSTQHYARLIEQPLYIRIMIRTAILSLEVTAITLLLGYPIALAMSRLRGWPALLVTACVLIPMWASILVRSYAWIIMLQRNGVVNNLLVYSGITKKPLSLLYTEGAVLMGMSHVLLPFMILPLYSVLRGIPDDLTNAAKSLGASHLRSFVSVTLPLSLPGVFAGSLIVFVLALGFYITPALLGGPRTLMISTLISQQVTEFLNFPFAGAISTVLLVFSIGITVVFRRLIGQGSVTPNG
jgi:mannopine transport system permease protein